MEAGSVLWCMYIKGPASVSRKMITAFLFHGRRREPWVYSVIKTFYRNMTKMLTTAKSQRNSVEMEAGLKLFNFQSIPDRVLPHISTVPPKPSMFAWTEKKYRAADVRTDRIKKEYG